MAGAGTVWGHWGPRTLALACLAGGAFLASPRPAAAQLLPGTLPSKTPAFSAAPNLSQILDQVAPIGGFRANLLGSPLLNGQGDPAASKLLPLTLQMGADSGLSFLYYTPAAVVAGANGQRPTLNTQRATFGFSDAFALGGANAARLTGLMYVSGGAMKNGRQAQSQVISQALDYARGGWSLQAHYQSVGKDFAGFDTVKGAAPSLGFLSGQTTGTLAALQKAVGKDDLGVSLGFADKTGHFGINLGQITDQVAKTRTEQQSLAFSKTFARGLQFDATRDAVTTHPFRGAALTTINQHWRLGYDAGRGTSFAADLKTLGTSAGSSERHAAYAFAHVQNGLAFHANYLTDSDSKGRDDHTLGLDLTRQVKNFTLAASFQQLSHATGGAQTTEHVQWNWQAQRAVALDGFWNDQKDPNGQGDDHTQMVHLNWQMHKDLTFEGRWTRESATRWAHAADERDLLLKGLIARNVSVDAHLNSKGQGGGSPNTQAGKDVKLVLGAPRLVGLRNASWTLSLAERITQDQLQSSVRACAFDAEARHNLVHLEYAGSVTGSGSGRSHLISRALRIVSNQPASWLQYTVYYKQRAQAQGTPLHDIRDYQLKMQRRQLAFQYHYVNQQENPDGSVTDLVQNTFSLTGPATKTLMWSAQFTRGNIASGKAGTEGFLLGVKGTLPKGQQMEVAYGQQEVRAGPQVVHGDTYRVNYQAKTSDTDLIGFDGQLTTWDDKTPQTPQPMVATVRLDIKKQY